MAGGLPVGLWFPFGMMKTFGIISWDGCTMNMLNGTELNILGCLQL